MKIGVVSLFPEAFEYLLDSKKSGLVGDKLKLNENFFIEDLRTHGEGKHQVVDAPPFGGGDGMIFKAQPLEEAFISLSDKMGLSLKKAHKIFLDPKGKSWTQKKAEALVKSDKNQEEDGGGLNLILLCGRYGGVDQRFLDEFIDESISVGRFILNGGELPALCLLESVVRILPQTLGNKESILNDSFSSGLNGGLEPSTYTRPQIWKGREIPLVYVSGHHEKIKNERSLASLKATKSWFEAEISELKEHLKAFLDSFEEPEA